MNIPMKPRHGEPVVKGLLDAINRIIDFLPSLQVRGDSKTTRVIETPFGRTISVIDNKSGIGGDNGKAERPYTYGIITNSVGYPTDDTGFYYVDIYDNGYEKPQTGSGYVEILNVGFNANLPSGTKIILFKDTIKVVPTEHIEE